MKSDYDKVNSDLSVAQSNVEGLQSDLEAAQSQSEVLQERMGRAKALMELINTIFIPSMTGEISTLTDAESVKLLFEWNEKIQATEDPTVEEQFNAFLDASSPVAEDEALMDFFLYIFENIPEILE